MGSTGFHAWKRIGKRRKKHRSEESACMLHVLRGADDVVVGRARGRLTTLLRFTLAFFCDRIMVGNGFLVRRRILVWHGIIAGIGLWWDLMIVEYRHHSLRVAYALIVRGAHSASLRQIMRSHAAAKFGGTQLLIQRRASGRNLLEGGAFSVHCCLLLQFGYVDNVRFCAGRTISNGMSHLATNSHAYPQG